MGEYNLTPIDGKIVVDGHVCTHESGNAYRVTDEYIVDVREWESDIRNKDLYAIISSDDKSLGCGRLLYVSTESMSELNIIVGEISKNSSSSFLVTYAMFAGSIFGDSIPMLTAICSEVL